MRRKIRIVVILVTGLVILFFGGSIIYEIGNRLSSRILTNLVQTESEGLYRVEFDDLELNPFRRILKISKARLIPIQEEMERRSDLKNFYEVSIDSVYIDLQSVLRLYTKKELLINGVEVTEPQIKMHRLNTARDPIKFGRETGDLYEAIVNYLEVLKIGYFTIKSGRLKHYPSYFTTGRIEFGVTNFLVDSSRSNQKFFYSESINLGIRNQAIYLPDSIHQITFNAFRLSTKDSILIFQNVSINTREGVNKDSIDQLGESNLYDIHLPRLELRGINFVNAYQNNILDIKEALVWEPKIDLKAINRKQKQNLSEKEDNSLTRFLVEIFDELKVNKFHIKDAALDLEIQDSKELENPGRQRFKANRTSMALYDIRLDSGNYRIDSRSSYLKNAIVTVQDYSYELPDNLHRLSFQLFTLNTFDSTLFFNELKIDPIRSASLLDDGEDYFSVHIPRLNLSGVAYQEALVDQKMSIQELTLEQPSIHIALNQKDEKSELAFGFEPKNLHALIKDYFYDLNSENINVKQGNFSFNSTFSLEDIDLTLRGANLDSTLSSWHQMAKKVDLQIGGLSFQNADHQVEIENILANDLMREYDILGINYSGKGSVRSVLGNELKITGLDLDSLITFGKPELKTLWLKEPSVKLAIQSKKEDKKNDIEAKDLPIPKLLESLIIERGTFDLSLDQSDFFSIKTIDLEVDRPKNLRIRNAFVEGMDWDSKTLGHDIHLNRLVWSEKGSQVRLEGFNMKPHREQDSLKFFVKSQSLKIINLDQRRILDEQIIAADSIIVLLDSTRIYAKLPFQTTDSEKDKGPVKSNFSFKIANVLIESPHLQLGVDRADSSLLYYSSERNRFHLQDFDFPSRSFLENDELLYSQNTGFELHELLAIPGNSDCIAVDHLQYESQGQKIALENFKYAGQDGQIQLIFPIANLLGWDPSAFFKHQELLLAKLETNDSFIQLRLIEKEENDDRENVTNDSLFQLPFKRVHIQSIQSLNNRLDAQAEIVDRRFTDYEADLIIENLAFDSVINLYTAYKNLDRFQFIGRHLKEDLGEFYEVNVDRYQYDYPEDEISLIGISIHPKIKPHQYATAKAFQEDWIHFNSDSLILHGFDLGKISRKEYLIQRADVINANLSVFRDLGLPQGEEHYKPLPQEQLFSIAADLFLDSLMIHHLDIYVNLKVENRRDTATLSFTEVKGLLQNITTREEWGTESMDLSASGLIKDSAPFFAHISFPKDSTNSPFRFTGSIEDLDVVDLNRLLIPLANVEIKSGIGHQMDFDFRANNDYALGTMRFKYNKLRIKVLNQNRPERFGPGQQMKTWLANSFVIRKRNPKYLNLKEGVIFYERDKDRSIFNFWGKALLSGILRSVSHIDPNRRDLRRRDEIMRLEGIRESELKLEPAP